MPKLPKPKVILWDLCDAYPRLLLLVSAPSGVIYTNQVGGTFCDHPEVEAVLVPLRLELKEGKEQADPLYDQRYSGYQPQIVEEWLQVHGLSEHFTGFGAEAVAEVTAEAWVPVRVKETSHPELKPFAHYTGVLTYQNSD